MSKTLIVLDVFLTLVAVAVEAVSKLLLLLVVPILNTHGNVAGFGHSQLEVLAIFHSNRMASPSISR